MRILVVEDDFKIAHFIKKGLVEEHYEVDIADNGEVALSLASKNYDLILLDIMIPLINGIDVCKILRDENITTPIIMLSARDKLEDKIDGLDSGANDYISKPFEFEELLARIRTQIRNKPKSLNYIVIEDLTIDTHLREVKRLNNIIKLTSKEYALLEYLALNKNKLVSESMIKQNLNEMQDTKISYIINVYIYRLRNKIDKNYGVKLIKTVRGAGYRLIAKNV